ncbi:Putative ribonuclease H protein [Dendrobium catenatum]|uniref:Ribonuclease H protein n=1 Tax=Dendrobium catenatum TaxID=906689 RepID=A0A2I0VFL0_9ASPA|nr:Putative ribonuclease H protein [Dendrobium catenatum]
MLLRAKIAWKFMNEEDSFLHKAFKPKYGTSCWNPNRKQNMSIAWKIILSGAKALKPIVRWKISNGENVNVMEDVWVLDKALSKWPTFLANLQSNELTVDYFVSNGGWDMEKLHQVFGEELIEIICKIQIDLVCHKDQMELILQNYGKSLTALSFQSIVSDSNMQNYCPWINKIKLNPRIEVFWWRLYHKAIPTFQFLEYRRLMEGNSCHRGCTKTEDIAYVAVTCDKMIQIMEILNQWGFQIPLFENLAECICWLEHNATTKTFLANVYFASMFLCWKSRNTLIHEDKEDSNLNIDSNVLGMSSISLSNTNNSGLWDVNQLFPLFNKCWHPPPPDWIKINVDGSFLSSYKAGIGAIYQYHKGSFFFCIWFQWYSLGYCSA